MFIPIFILIRHQHVCLCKDQYYKNGYRLLDDLKSYVGRDTVLGDVLHCNH